MEIWTTVMGEILVVKTITRYAADSEGPLNLNITKYGWEIKGTGSEPFPT